MTLIGYQYSSSSNDHQSDMPYYKSMLGYMLLYITQRSLHLYIFSLNFSHMSSIWVLLFVVLIRLFEQYWKAKRPCGESLEYPIRTRSMPCLLITWRRKVLASPGHQQAWYWLCNINRVISSLSTNFNNIHHSNFEEWYKMWIHFQAHWKQYGT